MNSRPQRTLKKEVSFSGVGLHTGKEVTLRFCPAPVNTGIVFQRMDLPGKPTVAARLENVQDTSRSTMIGVGNCSVQTVEHVLAALYACNVDNLIVQVSDGEPPVGDGSCRPFMEMIDEAKTVEQEDSAPGYALVEPVYFSQGNTHLVALPADSYKMSYTLHYPNTPLIRSQYFSFDVNEENFRKEVSVCRTFALYEEITKLMENGLIRGGSLENAVVIKDDVVLSKEGLRFPDEMVRHKTLDLIGDLALLGFHFKAHVIAIRSGHASNVAFGKVLRSKVCKI